MAFLNIIFMEQYMTWQNPYATNTHLVRHLELKNLVPTESISAPKKIVVRFEPT